MSRYYHVTSKSNLRKIKESMMLNAPAYACKSLDDVILFAKHKVAGGATFGFGNLKAKEVVIFEFESKSKCVKHNSHIADSVIFKNGAIIENGSICEMNVGIDWKEVLHDALVNGTKY